MVEKRFSISSEDYEIDNFEEFGSEYSEDFDGFEGQYNAFYVDIEKQSESEVIPAGIFSPNYGSLQAVVKFLKEKKLLKYSEIAQLLERDQRTIWNVYNKVKDQPLIISDSKYTFPVSILSNRDKNVLQALIEHFQDEGLSVSEISRVLNRNVQTIYTTIRKVKKSEGEQ